LIKPSKNSGDDNTDLANSHLTCAPYRKRDSCQNTGDTVPTEQGWRKSSAIGAPGSANIQAIKNDMVETLLLIYQ
jgi:hypothetical protein